MNYKETLDWLFSQLPMYQRQGKSAYKADLNTTLDLDEYFKHPHKNFRTIHIAGTNGKGSTSHMLASVLQEAGYKVGLYTSPHLKDFRERIKINGDMVSEQFVVDFIRNHKQKFEELKPSFFEMTVAMAFEYFSQEQVDVAVVEVGMGGRLDSTNIISPELSIITNIGLDHTAFLGTNLAQIAKEKAGIIKSGVPVVIGQTQEETKGVFREIAKQMDTEIFFADQEFSIDYEMLTLENKQSFNVKLNNENFYKNLELDLLGVYQKKNILTALKTVELLKDKYQISKQNIYAGLKSVVKNTGLLGRWQILNAKPLTICDTGHNEDGISDIIIQINQTAYKNLHFVLGVVDDKNIDTILGMLPKDAEYYFTRAQIPRALDENLLKEKAQEYNLKGKSYSSVKKALENAKKNAEHNDLIFIGGSTFVVAEVV